MRKTTTILLLLLVSTMLSAQSMTREQAASVADSLVRQWRTTIVKANAAELNSGIIRHDSLSMPFRVKLFGQKPEGGYPLYISMHGGGNAPKQVNDEQWQNQIMLYTPKCGYYISPRAPWDDWNMWFRPGIDELFERLITTLVAGGFVNPDKVYLMGYSAGGDGVWRLAPRLADHWAAASMMAGHPGESSVVNMMNTPFSVWCGALDSSYDRNTLCAQRGAILDSLSTAHPSRYVHETHIVPGKPHWMDRVDTVAVEWMAQYVRNSAPSDIVWRQEEVTRPRFYWLSVNPSSAKQGMTVRASIKGNVITISECDYPSLTVWLNDRLVNLDKPVTIRTPKRTLFKGKLLRSADTMSQSLALFNDPSFVYSAKVEVQ